MGKSIMVQGTASSAGKSLLVTALCRIFLQDGHKIAPFKSQNMSLNSFITREGLEMGRAQVVQAEAAGINPAVCMNPILLKPTTDRKSQVIVEGKVLRNMDAVEYFAFKNSLRGIVEKNFNVLKDTYDITVIEGAGSPAEINLKENDIVNMGMAHIADCPVIIVADIDRGGVFASIYGTYMLLDDDEKARVKGFVINKFRGDIDILKPGIDEIEGILGVPILGVIPYLDINIEDEDSLTDRFNSGLADSANPNDAPAKIRVIKLPHISNFTDMDVFKLFDVDMRFVKNSDEIDDADILIIPGTKNTIDDLLFLKEKGFDRAIQRLHEKDCLIAGICGGFQMLGTLIEDPHMIESDSLSVDGLGLLDIKTVMLKDKTTRQIEVEITDNEGVLKGSVGMKITGYEIHMGSTTYDDKASFINSENRDAGIVKDNVIGTYIHGFFDNVEFTRNLLNVICRRKGIADNVKTGGYNEFKRKEYDRLAAAVRNSIDMDAVYRILNNGA